MALAAGVAAVRQGAQAPLQVLQLRRAQADTLHRGAPPGGGQRGGAQQCAGVWVQGIDEHLLGLAVGEVVAVAPREAAAAAQRLPVGGAVTGTGEARGIDEGLGQQQGVAMGVLPIPGQAPQVKRQHPRGKIGQAPGRQHQEPRVVGDQVQALVVQHPPPADPGIARGALERRRLPPEQGQPASVDRRDVAQGAPEQRAQAQIVVLLDQRVPLGPLLGPDQADLETAQAIGTPARLDRRIGHVRRCKPFRPECPVPIGPAWLSRG
jgi:hypothetical protein